MMQLPTNAIYGLLYVARYSTQIKMFCTSFHTVHEWNCEAKIFPTFYYLYTGFIWVMENLESYVIYEFHFPGLESHEI